MSSGTVAAHPRFPRLLLSPSLSPDLFAIPLRRSNTLVPPSLLRPLRREPDCRAPAPPINLPHSVACPYRCIGVGCGSSLLEPQTHPGSKGGSVLGCSKFFLRPNITLPENGPKTNLCTQNKSLRLKKGFICSLGGFQILWNFTM